MMKPIRITLLLLLAMQLMACATSPSVQKQFGSIIAMQHVADDAYAHGDMQAALQGYDSLTKMAPTEPTYWFRLGNVLFRMNQLDAAVVDYQKAITLNPGYSEAWYNLGIVRMHMAQAAFVNASQHASANAAIGAQSAHLVDGISVLMAPSREDKTRAPATAGSVGRVAQGAGS